MKVTRKLFSAVAVTLCASIGLTFPTQVLATTISEDDTIYSSFDNIQGNNEIQGNIIAEIIKERTENSKSFLLDNGSTLFAQYNQPVHYLVNDEWVDYDNSLIVTDSTATADEAESGDYSNKHSNTSIKLSNKAKSNNMIKINSDNYEISWGYDNTNKSRISVIQNDEELYGNDKFTTLKNITSEAIYEDVYKNVDLQYFVTSTGIKENIILKDSDVQNEFNLTYKIKNLTAKQRDDYAIDLYNGNDELVYSIIAPYMIDAEGDSSNQLKLEIIEQKGSNLNVKLTADYWFIHSIGRAFPVTVDPEVTNKLGASMTFYEGVGGIYNTYGPYYLSDDYYPVVKINSLPILNDGERIISAKFNFETTNGSSVFTSETDTPIIVNAHKVTSLGNNVVRYEANVLDYDSLTYTDNENLTFDLTKTMKEWYNSSEDIDGFVFEAFDTIGTRQINIRESGRTTTTPSITITYKDFTGMENNLTYHTIPVGEKAQASVSDYLGNLVIKQNLYEGTGARMPVTLSATYNSINYNRKFENGSSSGYGWQFSFNQYIREADSTLADIGYNYIYTDSDGTDHYLKKADNSEEWYDEDGLGITLTVGESNITVENGLTTQTYELTSAGGKLISEKDENNNTITYSYTDGNITSITDGAGRVISFSFLTNDYGVAIRKIFLPDNSEIAFYYTTNERFKISYIEFPDDRVSLFGYDTNDRLVSVQQEDRSSAPFTAGNEHRFTYNDSGQVTFVAEYSCNDLMGNTLEITYGDDNTTTFKDRYGLETTHTFDHSGTLMSVLNADGYFESNYTSGMINAGVTDSFTKNLLTESYEFSPIGSGKYYKQDGTIAGVTSSGGTVEIDSSEATTEYGDVQYFGSNSIKISNPITEDNSAFYTSASYTFDPDKIDGNIITFSAYVKTHNVKWVDSSNASGALLEIYYSNGGYTNLLETSVGIVETEDWQRISVTAEIPQNAVFVYLKCSVKNTTGTAWFDCLQLEEGNCANDFNALQNSDFETNEHWFTKDAQNISTQNGTVALNGEAGIYEEPATTVLEDTSTNNEEDYQPETTVKTVDVSVPDSYIYSYDEYGNVIEEFHGTVNKQIKKYYLVESEEETTATESVSDEVVDSGDSSDEITLTQENSYIYQDVNVDRANVSFNIVGKAKAQSVPLTNSTRTFGIALSIYYEGETIPETHYQEFNAYTTQSQTVSMAIAPYDTDSVIDYVSFAFVYGNNRNTMQIDNAMLNIVGYPIKVADSSSDNTSTEDSSTTESSELDYDGYIYCEALTETANTDYVHTVNSRTYDTSGNYVTSETNRAGKTVYYTYDTNGNVLTSTDGEGNVINYTYNNSGRTSTVTSGDTNNWYYYNGRGDISAIGHNGFNYTFTYDDYGNPVSTNVGNVALTTNTYLDGNGNFIKTQFANNDYIEYTYDDYNRITKVTGEYGTIAEYIYNKKGKVAKAIDYSSDRTTFYYYDFTGAVMGMYCEVSGGDLAYYIGSNENGDKVEKANIYGHIRTITRGSDLNGNTFTESDGITVSKTVDLFGRTTQVKTENDETTYNFFTNYTYADGSSENSTVNLVKTLTQKCGDTQLVKYEYTYDDNGNITSIKENDTEIVRYTYDSLNQLIVSADAITGIYTSYTYDNFGNIFKVQEYELNTSDWSKSLLLRDKYYTYTDTNWKDKLTSYYGDTITYDAMGNPLVYRDGMEFTWENGRNLTKVEIGDNTVNMAYDSNGLRTQKQDNNYTINYYYDSEENLIALKASGIILYFYYDSDGNVTSFSHNGDKYYYLKNLQGDIVAIVDDNEKIVISYTYDAFGKIRSQTDDTIYNLANINPFRYRGYIYDTETGLYYLKSRYYDPTTGRFLNADIYCDTQSHILGTNMFAYCNNNPVNQVDPEGTDAIWLQFTDAVQILDSYEYDCFIDLGIIDIEMSFKTPSVSLGHTSLLVEDESGVWWYFYWGNKHMYLRPYGKKLKIKMEMKMKTEEII